MKINHISLFILLSVLIASGCKKDKNKEPEKIGGCSDPDSPFYKAGLDFDDSSCKFAFVSEVEILSFPATANGSSWDYNIGYTKPDIYMKIKNSNQTSYVFDASANNYEDCSAGDQITWTAGNQFKLTNSTWKWEMWDADGVDADDKMGEGNFTPLSIIDTDNNWVIIDANGGEFRIKLHLQIRAE